MLTTKSLSPWQPYLTSRRGRASLSDDVGLSDNILAISERASTFVDNGRLISMAGSSDVMEREAAYLMTSEFWQWYTRAEPLLILLILISITTLSDATTGRPLSDIVGILTKVPEINWWKFERAISLIISCHIPWEN